MFYNVKGQTYAYYVVLRALGGDFENVLRARTQLRKISDILRK